MVYNSPSHIKSILRLTYNSIYERSYNQKDFTKDKRILADLQANDPDSSFILEWIHRIAKELRISDEPLLRKINPQKEHTIGELTDIIMAA